MKKDGDAEFSNDGRRRLSLWRWWASGPRVLWVCLNPSKAGKKAEDQSTRKIRGFSEDFGCGSYLLMNLFDWCSTDPRGLTDERRPASGELCLPDNFARISAAARDCRMVVCAWGRHGRINGQAGAFLAFMRERGHGKKLRYLRLNVDGTPAHPLMLPYGLVPKPLLEER